MAGRKECNLTKEEVKKAKDEGIFKFTNKVLYDLVKDNPTHDEKKEEEVVTAKIWIIGRTHAAPIERGETSGMCRDTLCRLFAEKSRKAEIDRYISTIRNSSKSIDENKDLILETETKLVKILQNLTRLQKRSLASKYLHYHLPEFIFIYDQRARSGLSKISPHYVTKRERSGKFDNELENFFLKMLDLQECIRKEFGMLLKPREIDRLLLNKSRGSSK